MVRYCTVVVKGVFMVPVCPFWVQPFVKVVKNKAYFKRYQVKFRRRRGVFVNIEVVSVSQC